MIKTNKWEILKQSGNGIKLWKLTTVVYYPDKTVNTFVYYNVGGKTFDNIVVANNKYNKMVNKRG